MIMLNKNKVESDFWKTDEFLNMDFEAQALFFHYYVCADKELKVRNPRAIARMVGVDEETIQNLKQDGFIENIEG